MGRFHPADHSKGDANTVGGYQAVHGRPAAFEGSDGVSYTVEIIADETGPEEYAGYLLFVRWSHGDPIASGHLETGYLVHARTEERARELVGAMPLSDARAALDTAIAARRSQDHSWWEAMRNDTGA